jgi:hypothetical protein
MRPISAAAGRRVASTATTARLATTLPPQMTAATATAFPIRTTKSPTAGETAARRLTELEQRKRSVSATLRRIRCEQTLAGIQRSREREVGRLEQRIHKVRCAEQRSTGTRFTSQVSLE